MYPRTTFPFFDKFLSHALPLCVNRKPIPWLTTRLRIISLLIPSYLPLMLTTLPPELPGLIGGIVLRRIPESFRCLPDDLFRAYIPWLTLSSSPNGITNRNETSCPNFSKSDGISKALVPDNLSLVQPDRVAIMPITLALADVHRSVPP